MSKSNVTRRAFLGASAGLSLSTLHARASAAPSVGRAKSCIVLVLTGGASQIETWDPKPDAPTDVRGPFRSSATSVPGTQLGEHLPRMAGLAHRYAIVRSVHHDAPPMHEAGLQLLQTGRLVQTGIEFPHFGAVLARHLGPKRIGAVPFVMLPAPIGNMGINVSRGQSAGFLGAAHEPAIQARFTHLLSPADRERYGKTAFGAACARSLQLVEQGVRCVVVNMFDSVYDRITWDCHADRHSFASTLEDYRRTLCPRFDRACAALLDDLHQRGLLDETLVAVLSEFGRTPRLNAQGGRDHWPGCWSIVLAGGGVRGGVVVGASDRHGAAPVERPVTCAEIVASIYHTMGLAPAMPMAVPDRRTMPLVDAAPIRELF